MSYFFGPQLEPSGATLSADGRYRYRLWRVWDRGKPRVVWCCLNPSTADHSKDDPTVRRLVGFARAWGAGSISVVNLFALRATDPRELTRHKDPVGPGNDEAILSECTREGLLCVVAGWGARGNYQWRDRAALALLRERGVRVKCLGVTAGGQPKHPLYQGGNTPLRDMEGT